MAQSRQFGIVGNHPGVDETLEAERQRHQAGHARCTA